MVVLMAEAFSPAARRWSGPMSMVGLVAVGLAALVPEAGGSVGGVMVLDRFAGYFDLLLCALGLLAVMMAIDHLPVTGVRAGEYYALILFAVAGLVVMVAATELVVMFLGLETASIAVYALAGISRGDPRSNEAALKYFLLGAFASAVLIYGIALVYASVGSTRLAELHAALAGAGGIADPAGVEATTRERWDQIIAVNQTGVWLGMKYEILQMLEQGGGAIVNTASVAGLVAIRGTCAYVASKHAVAGLTKAAALEYAQAGIRVNAVCPGYIRTPLTQPLFDNYEGFEDQAVARHPLGRLGEPHEIAEAVAWLSSDAASFVTGHTMTIDGGYVAQ